MKLLKTDLRNDISELKNNATAFGNDVKTLKSYVKDLNDNYQSNEASKYIEKLNVYLLELDKITKNFDNSISYLNGVISIYDELDSTFIDRKPVK